MNVSIPYASTTLTADASAFEPLGVLDVADAPAPPDLIAAAQSAFAAPIAMPGPAFAQFRTGDRVAILVPDSFRKTKIHQILPTLIEALRNRGVREEDIFFVYATGTHRAPTRAEEDEILGPALRARFEGRTFAHDPDDAGNLVHLGVTRRGTPVHINRRVHEADRIIATGATVLHYFGGFGGGRKSVAPGVAGRETISHNHALNLDPVEDRLNPAVGIGVLDGNPVAEDMLEAARLTHVDFIVNTALNRAGEIAQIFVGKLDAAHRAACAFARELYAVPIAARADLVIAASPATRNFLQTHKALFNAHQAVKPGGRIILAAPCPEGVGGEQFTKWLRLGGTAEIIRGLRVSCEINGQTALSTLHKGPMTIMITEMPESDVALLRARKAATLDEALRAVRGEFTAAGVDRPTFYVMPSAAYAVPMCVSETI